jgi:uncharacterized protein YoxC
MSDQIRQAEKWYDDVLRLTQEIARLKERMANMHEDLERKQARIDKLVDQVNVDWKQIYALGKKPTIL